MSLETDCEIKLKKDGETVIDARRASFLEKIIELGSLDTATESIGVSLGEAKVWLQSIDEAIGANALTYASDGKVLLTDEGRSILDEFRTRSRMATSQVQNMWKKPWVTTDGIVVIEDQVVLIKRGREPFKGMYALPGGIVEYGETVEECVVREMEEETGLKTEVLDLVGVYSAANRDPRGHFITLAFNLKPICGQLTGGDDAAEAVLFPLKELPVMASDHRVILYDALMKRGQYGSSVFQDRPEL
ncbi:MAG TPA: NUDIX domain-containing protein [Methanomassiliicoccales archaeon]|jgi:8-oxo-dGTP diphosphatase